jgi:F0F1-type ATP synthase membrane subunit a
MRLSLALRLTSNISGDENVRNLFGAGFQFDVAAALPVRLIE